MPGIRSLMVVSVLILMLFSILGVTLFKGRSFYCQMDNMPVLIQKRVQSKWDCYDLGGEWELHDTNFDNVANGMITMFILMTTEGWVQIMWNGVDVS